jgi:hypothetical protein
MIVTMKLDKTKTVEATQNVLAAPLSGCANHTCPDLKAIYLFILKTFCFTSVLGWLFIACPAAVAEDAFTENFNTYATEQPDTANVLNLGWNPTNASQYNFSWQQQNPGEYRSADGLHVGVKRLRQILSTWWASKPDQSAITTQVKSLMTATGDGPYAAWSYNIGASSKALEINIRYEF